MDYILYFIISKKVKPLNLVNFYYCNNQSFIPEIKLSTSDLKILYTYIYGSPSRHTQTNTHTRIFRAALYAGFSFRVG